MASRKPVGSQLSTNKRTAASPRSISRRAGKTIKAAVDDFLLDRQSQNHSPQTLRWHTIALDHFVTFLEQEHQGCLTLTVKQDEMVGEMVGDGHCFWEPHPSILVAGKILVAVRMDCS